MIVFQTDLTCLKRWGTLPCCWRPTVAPPRPGDVNGPLGGK